MEIGMENGAELTARCGLWCGECVIRCGRLADKAAGLLEEMARDEFGVLARGLAEARPLPFAALTGYRHCMEVLEAMRHLDCDRPCRQGGGGQSCRIKSCSVEKGFAGCWECGEYANCPTLAELAPIHGGACRANLEKIRKDGLDAFALGEKHWYLPLE
jgi:hypothetical protein